MSGGLVGGLYAVFVSVGSSFFYILIGNHAHSNSMRMASGFVGGLLCFLLPSVIFVFLGSSGVLLLVGPLMGGALALFLGTLVESIEKSTEKEETEKRVFNKHYKSYKNMGLDDFEAKLNAKEKTKNELNPSCFIATVVYGNDTYQIKVLRRWRSDVLSKSIIGRAAIVLYYLIGPKCAILIGSNEKLITITRKKLDKLVSYISNQ